MKAKFLKFWWAIPALLGLVAALFKGTGKWKDRAKKAQKESTQSKHDVVDANNALNKEKINHEAEEALDDIDGQSTSDMYNEAVDELGLGDDTG